MCDFSGRLVAWIDRELPDNEAADVERHVRDCPECRRRVDAYEEVSRAFVAYCDASDGGNNPSHGRAGCPSWRALQRQRPCCSSSSASIRQADSCAPASGGRLPGRHPGNCAKAGQDSPSTTSDCAREDSKRELGATEPAIQIAIPAEAMFPPGAVPEGLTFIADLSMAADGSAQGLRLQP